MHVLYTLSCSQLDLNPANLQATVKENELWRFSSCENGIFKDVTITSSLRSDVQVLMGHFTIFQSHRLSG